MYYFFKTMHERGRNRLRALTGQHLPDGSEIDPTLNVQSDKSLRLAYPLGTIFGSNSCSIRSGFYEAGQIYPLNLKSEDYKERTHVPPTEMQEAYNSWVTGRPMLESTEEKDTPEVPASASTDTYKGKPTFLSRMLANKKLAAPSIHKHGFYVDKDNWYLMLRNIQNQVNTMIIGPTGTGKTELVMLACKKLGIACHVYDMGSMYDPVAGLLGVHRLSKGGISVFDYAKFTQDIQEPGVVLLDELSRAPLTSQNILFPCLDSRRCLPVEIAGGDDVRNVKVHPECTFFATANVGAEYTGTMSMDRALINRFFPMELDYMPASDEVAVLQKRCYIDKDKAELVVKVANNVRSMYRKQEISCSLSTRETLMVGDLVSDGWDVLSAMELIFLPLFEGTKSDGERGVIAKTLMTM